MASDDIERVREATDIVELIGGYFPLKRSGSSFKARCPFHEEKTGSFNVNPGRQTFYCFGCQEKGGVFDFVMKMERVEFKDALVLLADRANISLEPETPGGEQKRSFRADLYRLHEWAHQFYLGVYRSPEGAACREYVKGRGISDEIVQEFGVCYAPDSWTTFVGRAGEAGFPPQLLEKAGLARVGVKRPGHYDWFRDRLVFAIGDAMGRVVAFGARALAKEGPNSEPKYLNSPETDIFHKGKTLYGIDRLRKHLPRGEPILVMEGYTDVLMSTQVGVHGAVATLGTALTPEHARVLARYSDSTVLVYDGDVAGLTAAERGALLLLEAGHLDIKVAVLPAGQDPCDFFSERGAAGREELLDVTTDLLDFLLERSGQRFDLTATDGRRRAAGELIRPAAAVTDPIAFDLVLQRISEFLKISVAALREGVHRIRRGGGRSPRRGPSTDGPPEEKAAVSLDAAHHDLLEAVLNDPGLLGHPFLGGGEPPPEITDPRVRSLVVTFLAVEDRVTGNLLAPIEDPEQRELSLGVLLPEDHGRNLSGQLEGAVLALKNSRELSEARRRSRELEDGGDSRLLLEEIQQRFRTLKGGSRGTDPTEDASMG